MSWARAASTARRPNYTPEIYECALRWIGPYGGRNTTATSMTAIRKRKNYFGIHNDMQRSVALNIYSCDRQGRLSISICLSIKLTVRYDSIGKWNGLQYVLKKMLVIKLQYLKPNWSTLDRRFFWSLSQFPVVLTPTAITFCGQLVKTRSTNALHCA